MLHKARLKQTRVHEQLTLGLEDVYDKVVCACKPVLICVVGLSTDDDKRIQLSRAVQEDCAGQQKMVCQNDVSARTL